MYRQMPLATYDFVDGDHILIKNRSSDELRLGLMIGQFNIITGQKGISLANTFYISKFERKVKITLPELRSYHEKIVLMIYYPGRSERVQQFERQLQDFLDARSKIIKRNLRPKKNTKRKNQKRGP